VRRVEGRAIELTEDERHDEAERVWREAIDGYAGVGATAREQLARCWLGTTLCHTGRSEEGRAMVEAAAAHLVTEADPELRAEAQLWLSLVYLMHDEPAESLAAVDRAVGYAAEAPEPLIAAEADLRRAQVLLALDRYDEGLAAARGACQRYAAVGDPPIAGTAHLLLGDALIAAGETPTAVAEAYTVALARTSEERIALLAHRGLGRALLAADRTDEAIDHLVEAVAGFVAADQEAPAAFTRLLLAQAYEADGRPLDAAEAAEEALIAFERMGVQGTADQCRHLLSVVYRQLDQPDQALDQLDRLVVNLDGFDNLAVRGQMHEEAAQVLYDADRDGQAAQRFATAAETYAAAGLRLDETRARRWSALSWRWADQPDLALDALAAADICAAGLPADEPAVVWERAMLGFDAARVFIGADRYDDALGRLDGVAAAFRSIEAGSEALHTDLLHGELLLRTDRPVEAEAVLRGALAAADPDTALRQNAAFLLGAALDALGRSAEAKALRSEYGLDEE
jgi:tetratricopeptide (TPR) repeat protein